MYTNRLRDYALAFPALLVATTSLIIGRLGAIALGVGAIFFVVAYLRRAPVQPVAADLVTRDKLHTAQRVVDHLSAQVGITAPTCLYAGDARRSSYAAAFRRENTIVLTSMWYELQAEDPFMANSVLAHEVGHCVHRNLPALRIGSAAKGLAGVWFLAALVQAPGPIDRALVVVGALAAWCSGQFIAMAARQHAELEADAFAKSLGFGPKLITFLEKAPQNTRVPQVLFSHPTNERRVATLF
jgi:Zn-dependent protease with chaperone function